MTAKTTALLFLLLASGCAEPAGVTTGGNQTRIPSDDDAWGLVPAEADLALWADLGKLRASPWTREGFAQLAGEQVDRDARFDLVRDMDHVLFAKLPSLRDGASVLIAQGSVDRAATRRAFTKDRGEGEASSYRGAELLVRGDEALGFLGKRTVLSGLTVAVRAALDCNFGVARTLETEPWFEHLRRELERIRDPSALVTALYIHLQPATRAALMRDMGEGGSLEDFAGRVDLAADLHATTIGVVPTEADARDLAARLSERLRDARVRPIVEAFGLGSVLEAVRIRAKATLVFAELAVSESQRAEIVRRMAVVADTMAAMRKPKADKPQP
jgi:hypothetical protein